MNVFIRNVGKVANADIVIDGLTAIIGDNDRGKSTVGKSLYALFHSFKDIDERLYLARTRYVIEGAKLEYNQRMRYLLRQSDFSDGQPLTRDALIQRLSSRGAYYIRPMRQSVSPAGRADDLDFGQLADRILELLSKVKAVPMNELLHTVVTESFNNCFDDQFRPIYRGFGGTTEVGFDDGPSHLRIKWGEGGNSIDFSALPTLDAWFIGTPLVLDACAQRRQNGTIFRRISLDDIHNELVSRIIRGKRDSMVADIIAASELEPVVKMVNERLPNPLDRRRGGKLTVEDENMSEPLSASNLSMGLKVFSVLKLMLEANVLAKGDIIILDEPENHLHPAFQELFARIVVELQRIAKIKILITTHSPYFLQALELYSRKCVQENGQGATLRVYQPEIADVRGMVTLVDISGDTSKMYRKFAQAMREMDLLRNAVDNADEARGSN